MVTKFQRPKIRVGRSERGALMTEIVVAMGILAIAVIPLSVGFMEDLKVARSCYYQAVAMEVVDGEMEILVAGEWKNFKPGTNAYTVRAESVTNLPPGKFQLVVQEPRLRLEWVPNSRGVGGTVAREVKVK